MRYAVDFSGEKAMQADVLKRRNSRAQQRPNRDPTGTQGKILKNSHVAGKSSEQAMVEKEKPEKSGCAAEAHTMGLLASLPSAKIAKPYLLKPPVSLQKTDSDHSAMFVRSPTHHQKSQEVASNRRNWRIRCADYREFSKSKHEPRAKNGLPCGNVNPYIVSPLGENPTDWALPNAVDRKTRPCLHPTRFPWPPPSGRAGSSAGPTATIAFSGSISRPRRRCPAWSAPKARGPPLALLRPSYLGVGFFVAQRKRP